VVLIKADGRRDRPSREKIEMTFKASEIPFESYWAHLREEQPGISIYSYPLASVFASSRAEADATAGPENAVETYDQRAYFHLGLDSTEASIRLGTFGRPDLDAQMRRGD
jgi:hypothetical protein